MKPEHFDENDKNIYVRQFVSPDDNLVRDVLKQLKNIKVPTNYDRLNSGVGRSITLGLQNDRYHHRYHSSRFTDKFPELQKAVFALGKKICPFPFTSVQVNHNYKTKPHYDENNAGMSVIIGLGDYTGGQIVVDGKPYDIKYRPIAFNGSLHKHQTLAFKGDRYSLVFFNLNPRYKPE